MADKVTTMVINGDLQCPNCYRKIKKLLSQYPQIHNQIYDAKQNTVTITVVCSSPEKFRDKLWCRGGKSIKSIEIIVPPKPKPAPAAAPATAPAPAPAMVPKPTLAPTLVPVTPAPVPISAYPSGYPIGTCCGSCYPCNSGWPCYNGYGGRQVPYFDNYGYGGNRGGYTSRYDPYYFSEENTQGCTIM